VVDARSPHDVVALAGHVHDALCEVETEVAFNQQEEGGSLVVGGLLRALVASRVDAPLHFDILG
jgi:hypothetical protein